MTKLHELLQQKAVNGSFGLEIETEGKNLIDAAPPQWRIENDGSLRGGFPYGCAEYVFKKPLDFKKAIDAVTLLRKYQDDKGATLDFSFRTSVHVHVNVQQLTFNQYLNMIYTYFLIEEPLVHYCGKERIGNRFCLRLQDAEGLLDYVFMLFRNGYTALRHLQGDAIRYAAINLAATTKYGSLEFRSLRGNMDVEYISNWVQALDNLRDFATRFDNPQQIHDLFVKSEPEDFAAAVLGDVYEFFDYIGMANDMRRSFSLTLELPYNFIDHSKQEEALLQELREKKERRDAELREILERERLDQEARQQDRARRRNAEMPMAVNPAQQAIVDNWFADVARMGMANGDPRIAVPRVPRVRPEAIVNQIIVDDVLNEDM